MVDIRKKSSTPAPAPIPEEILFGRLPSPPSDRPSREKPRWKPSELPPDTVEIRYWYSQTQWVSRFQWEDKSNPKGYDKTFRQGHIKPDGSSEWKKGSAGWLPYRFDEVLAHCKGLWAMLLEGEECVEEVREILTLVAITLQGSSWSPQSIENALSRLKEAGIAGIVFPRDNDDPGLKKAKTVMASAAKLNFPCLVVEPTDIWSDMPQSGDIVDFIRWGVSQGMDRENFIERLEQAIHEAIDKRHAAEESRSSQQQGERSSDSGDLGIPSWSQSDISLWLAERYRPKLAWNTSIKEWYRYSAEVKGIWGKEPKEFVWQIVISEIEALAEIYQRLRKKKPTYSADFISGTEKLLKAHLAVRKWDETPGLLPLLNGVLNLETKELMEHAPFFRLTWCLPYEYDEKATCFPICEWMLSMCASDEKLVEFDRAYLNAVVKGRTDLQSFRELIGPGGTGKSTLIRLAMALVGVLNTHTTTLKKLESSRFETANIEGKRLVVVTDSERYAGPVSILKALTGEDSLPYEKKFKQGTPGFFPEAMVIVAANELPQSGDYTSGLERRRSGPVYDQSNSPQQAEESDFIQARTNSRGICPLHSRSVELGFGHGRFPSNLAHQRPLEPMPRVSPAESRSTGGHQPYS